MGYSDNPDHVRADFFMPSGKWKYTEVLDFAGLYYGTCGEPGTCQRAPHDKGMFLHDACAAAWRKLGRHRGLVMVVLKPMHEYKHPIALRLSPSGVAVPVWAEVW